MSRDPRVWAREVPGQDQQGLLEAARLPSRVGGEATAWRYADETLEVLAAWAPGLTAAPCPPARIRRTCLRPAQAPAPTPRVVRAVHIF